MTVRVLFFNAFSEKDPHLNTVEPSVSKFKSKRPPNLMGWGEETMYIYIYIYILSDFKLDISITHVCILTYKFCFELK